MSLKEIENEVKNFIKPKVSEIEDNYPFEKLTPRGLEILTYYLFKNNITKSGFYDSVEIMQGVGERGRDCVLYKNGRVVGVIQCKHSSKIEKKYNINEIGGEIVKFALNYLQDKDLIADLSTFKYLFVTNTSIKEE